MATDTTISAPIDAMNRPPAVQRPKDKAQWLNSAYISQNGVANMTIKDFTVTKAATHPVDSYWSHSHVDWALEFLRRRYTGLKDVFIASTSTAWQLYRIAMVPGFLDAPDTETYRQNWAPLVNVLKSRDIVVIPMHNGIKEHTISEPIITEGLTEKDKPQKHISYKPAVGQGNHWSFMVIDRRAKEHSTARYVDGMVKAVKRKNKWKIRGTNLNAPIAGKVLCGFETLIDLKKGGFDTSTLKFVPHMKDADAHKGTDHGRCGPHLYAFIDHLLKNKEKLVDSGLQASFNKKHLQDQRSKDFNFNSRSTRSKLEYELHHERRRQEGLQPDNHRDNLTLEVITALHSILTVDQLISLAADSQDPSPPQRKKCPHKANRGGGGDKGDDGNDGDDDDDWPDPHEEMPPSEYSQYLFNDRTISKAEHLEYAINNDKTIQKSIQDSDRRYGVLTKYPIYKYPKGFSKDKLPDFAKLTFAATDTWRELYKDDIFKLSKDRGLDYATIKAILHCIYKGTFQNESHERLIGYLHDGNAFSYNERLQNWTREELAMRLDECYLELQMPLFASLSNEEVDNWIRNLHSDAKAIVQDERGNNLHNRARGMLHRFFIGDLEDMTDEEVGEWRASDPAIPEGYKKDVESARYWIKWHYGTEKPVPYMRESPLHWPSRVHRPSRGRKRKRDDNDDGNDSGNGTKRPKPGYEREDEDPKRHSA